MRFKALACLAGMVLAAPALAQSVETPNVKITLDWAFQGPQSIYLYGQEKGRFKEVGIEPTIDRGNGSAEVMTRVASGAYQFGWADIATMIKFNASNPAKALQAVYVTGGASPNAIMMVAGKGINTPKDLEGKTLDATAGSAAYVLFPAFAAHAGFDPSKVTWKTVSGALREPLLAQGKVDGVAGFTTSSIMTLVDLGIPLEKVQVFHYNDYGVKQYGTAIVVQPGFAKANPKTVTAVVKAINASLMDAIKDPQASVQAIKARDPLVNMKTECIRLVDGLKTLTLTPDFVKGGISTIDPVRMKAAIDETVKAFDIKTPVDPASVYTTAYLPPVSERMPPTLGSCS